jgi:uncharacterized membrane protein YjfL (UPF0719 family)
MLELVGQTLAYTGVGLAILVVGFYVMDALTPGKLGTLVGEGNPNAAVLAGTTLLALGLVMWFAIFFTGAGWDGLDDALVFGLVGVAAQAAGFVIIELLIPGSVRDCVQDVRFHTQTAVLSGAQIAIALVICASLT